MDAGVRLTDVQEQILNKIRSTPGISQTAIAKDINQNRKLVYYHIKRLSDEGLVYVQPNGRETKCYILDRTNPTLAPERSDFVSG
jgi:predicted transcriptional regulator